MVSQLWEHSNTVQRFPGIYGYNSILKLWAHSSIL
nr:MAG TPA: hypothetical protein [Caudoviricetes sp.]